MSTVIVKDNETLDSAIRRWKKKCANDGIIGDLRRKEAYEKPSVRRKKKGARKKQRLRAKELINNFLPEGEINRRYRSQKENSEKKSVLTVQAFLFLNFREENYYAHFGILFRQIGRNRAQPDAFSFLKMAARSSTFVHFPRRFVQSVKKSFPNCYNPHIKTATLVT